MVAYLPDGTRLITGYVPSAGLAGAGLGLYGLVCIIAWAQFFTIKRQRYMLTLTIGLTCMVLGFILRFPLRSNPGSVGLYAIAQLFLLLPPCAFLALEYMLLGRLANYLGPETVGKKCMIFRANLIAKFFVTTDVVTFLVQGGGGGLSASDNPDTANIGQKIALAGVIIQAVAFCTFTAFLMYFGYRVKTLFPNKWNVPKQYNRSFLNIFSKEPIHDWRILYFGMLLACIGFIIRSIFRAIEFAQGYEGELITTEGYLYGLDALPIWLSVLVFIVFFPPRFLAAPQLFADDHEQLDMHEKVSNQNSNV